MNMPMNLNVSRIESKIRELAEEKFSDLELREGELDILLSDPAIYNNLEKRAQSAIEEADERRKQEILTAARKNLGMHIEKPKKVLAPLVLAVPQQPVESAWQKYLCEGNHSLPASLARLETREEVSAARGFLIRVLTRHRQNADWIKEELKEAVGIWDKRAQKILRIINDFFGKKEDIPMANSEVYFKVSSLLEGDQELQWYLGGPVDIQVELDAKKKEQELAQQRTAERQQKKEALAGKKQKIIALLAVENILGEDAEKLAAATVKKFPELEAEEAMLKMAINRQISAIQQNRDFMQKVAPGAQQYFLGSGVSENEFLVRIHQHPEVISLINRDAADSRICRR